MYLVPLPILDKYTAFQLCIYLFVCWSWRWVGRYCRTLPCLCSSCLYSEIFSYWQRGKRIFINNILHISISMSVWLINCIGSWQQVILSLKWTFSIHNLCISLIQITSCHIKYHCILHTWYFNICYSGNLFYTIRKPNLLCIISSLDAIIMWLAAVGG